MNSDFYKMLLFLLLLLIIVCSLNFYALRRLLLDLLVGARNRKNAYKIHKEQKAKDRFTLSYIEPMIKRYTYEFRFFHRCYMVLIYYSAALCILVPVFLATVSSETVNFIVLCVLNSINILINILIRIQFDASWVSKYAKKRK